MTLRDRFEALTHTTPQARGLPVEASLQLRRSTLQNYAALSEHHYRAVRPATATRVLALEHDQPGVCGRFLGRRGEKRVVAVLVESLPSLSCRLRDWALGERYRRIGDARARAAVLNSEVRCISRVVVHPQWRGVGLAVRLVRQSLMTAETPLTEALAAMGKVHPFFERAGMAAHHRPPHVIDTRLSGALASAGLEPLELAHLEHAWARLGTLPAAQQGWLLGELRRWYRQTRRISKIDGVAPLDMLRAARQRLLCEPVYYLKDNRT